jgi:hypothetical protein
MNGCPRYAAYLQAERRQLVEAIAEHRVTLSLEAGRDVGQNAAESDFVARLMDAFDREFRSSYCRRCSDAEECPLYDAAPFAAACAVPA